MGYRIKELREARHMTQAELAKKSGISRGTISALEQNTMRETTTKTLVSIAKALDSTVDQLFICSECLTG